LKLFPAIRCNLFFFKEKKKRIFTAIWARVAVFKTTICLYLQQSFSNHKMKNKSFLVILFLIIIQNLQAQKPMITPPYLKKGDTIAIVATARKNITDNLKPAIDLAKSWGLEVIIGTTIGLDNNQLAGTDQERAADFQDKIDNPNIKAIWCARGGYGTVRMLDLIDFSKFIKNPKWIVGFSDVTVLHSHLHHLGFETIHGIMPVNIEKASPIIEETLRKALFGENITYQVPYEKENKLGKTEGELIGGNLSILYSLMGSESQVDCKGKILFIEDLDEYLYHIDRMMMSLKRCGCFENLSGLVVGSFTKMKDNDIPWGKSAYQIIADITKNYNFPIVYHFPAGHVHENNTLVLGKKVFLEVAENITILKF
jgi:muramoyltetrapeptide carboxypeptidase